jgi:cation diffusion facilitator family transporter
LVSVFAAIGLVAAKLIAGWLTNSLAIYSEAGHSGVDLLAALISFFAILSAGRPPDPQHHFGHAKFESVGALIELTFLVVLGFAIIYSAQDRLFAAKHPEVSVSWTAILLVFITISVDLWRTITLFRAARKTGSEALSASAMHFFSDLLGTITVVFGLAMTAMGHPHADSIAALVIAGLVLYLSFRMGRHVFSSLTDKAPAGMAEEVEKIVRSVLHVIAVHDIRIRQAGSEYFTEMHVDLEHDISLGQAHDVLDLIEHELTARYPRMHITTHPEPWESEMKTPGVEG